MKKLFIVFIALSSIISFGTPVSADVSDNVEPQHDLPYEW
jgi:hypothetical protein